MEVVEINLPRELITNHLDVDSFVHVIPQVADKVFINPWLEFAHPGQNQSTNEVDLMSWEMADSTAGSSVGRRG